MYTRNIAFTGIRNISFLINNDTVNKTNIPTKDLILTAELTNDKDGNDLSEYLDIIDNTDPKFENPYLPGFVSIDYYTINGNDYPSLYFNNEVLSVNKKNMPLFKFIGKLKNKIEKLPDDKFVSDNISSENDYTYLAMLLDKLNWKDVNKFQKPDKIKKGVNKLQNKINNLIIDKIDYIG